MTIKCSLSHNVYNLFMVADIFDIFLIQTRMYNGFDSISSLSQVPYSTRILNLLVNVILY